MNKKIRVSRHRFLNIFFKFMTRSRHKIKYFFKKNSPRHRENELSVILNKKGEELQKKGEKWKKMKKKSKKKKKSQDI
jgi:hypothetical protein